MRLESQNSRPPFVEYRQDDLNVGSALRSWIVFLKKIELKSYFRRDPKINSDFAILPEKYQNKV